MSKTTGEKKTCLCCTKEYAVSSFYSHRNELINDKFGICKKCVKSKVQVEKMDTLYKFLQTMDIPYLKRFWKSANESDNETIGTYLKNLNSLQQNSELRFEDSDSMNTKTNNAELVDIDSDFELTTNIIRKWGRGLELEDYMFLEEEFENIGGHEAETTVQEKLFKNMAHTQLQVNKAIETGDTVTYEKMTKILSTQMNDANVKPVQLKGISDDGATKSYGEMIRMIENDEPCTDNKDYEPTYVKQYVERFFISQIKRVFGRVKDEDIKKLEGEE